MTCLAWFPKNCTSVFSPPTTRLPCVFRPHSERWEVQEKCDLFLVYKFCNFDWKTIRIFKSIYPSTLKIYSLAHESDAVVVVVVVVTVVVVVGGGVVVVVMMVVLFSPEFSPPSGSGFLSSEQKNGHRLRLFEERGWCDGGWNGKKCSKNSEKRTSKNRHHHEKQHKSSGAFEEQMLKGEEHSWARSGQVPRKPQFQGWYVPFKKILILTFLAVIDYLDFTTSYNSPKRL